MDPIADMFSLINNAIAVSKQQVVIFPYSDFKFSILELFKKQGLVTGVEKKGRLSSKRIILTLKYDEKGNQFFLKLNLFPNKVKGYTNKLKY